MAHRVQRAEAMPARSIPSPLSPLPFALHGNANGWARRAAALQAPLPPRSVEQLSRRQRAGLSSGPQRRDTRRSRVGLVAFLGYGLAIGAIGGLLAFHRQAAPVTVAVPVSAPAPLPAARAVAAEPATPQPAAPAVPAEPEVAEPAAPAPSTADLPNESPPAEVAAAPERELEEPEPPAPVAEAPAIRAFDRAAAASAVRTAAAGAAACGGGEHTGATRVAVTFAPSGRATLAVVEPGSPFAGSSVGSCIATRMRTARIPPFDGELVTVHTTLMLR